MTLLSDVPSQHPDFKEMTRLLWEFAAEHGISTIEKDETKNRQIKSFTEAQMFFDQIVMNAMSESPLLSLADVRQEIEQSAKQKKKMSRSKVGNFVVTAILRAAFWQKHTSELCWLLGMEVADKALRSQLEAYHAKIVGQLLKDHSSTT
jgi:hypothetical protein